MASPPVKLALGKWFLWTHRPISSGAISLLLRHVLKATSQRARILITSSCGFWVATTAFRILKLLYYRRISDVIEVLDYDPNGAKEFYDDVDMFADCVKLCGAQAWCTFALHGIYQKKCQLYDRKVTYTTVPDRSDHRWNIAVKKLNG